MLDWYVVVLAMFVMLAILAILAFQGILADLSLIRMWFVAQKIVARFDQSLASISSGGTQDLIVQFPEIIIRSLVKTWPSPIKWKW